MKLLILSATAALLVLSVVTVRADVVPSREQVEQILTDESVVNTRARKYQGSRAGAR